MHLSLFSIKLFFKMNFNAIHGQYIADILLHM